jgi:hypothetical protein
MANRLERQEANQLQEEFLGGLSERLRSEMHPLEFNDTVLELRSHLEASAMAYEELGLSPIGAAKAAIQSLGAASKLEYGLITEHRRKHKWAIKQLAATLIGTVCGMAALGAYLVLVWFLFHPTFDRIPLIVLERSAEVTLYGGAVGLLAYRSGRKPIDVGFTSALALPLLFDAIDWAQYAIRLILRESSPHPPNLSNVPAFAILAIIGFAVGISSTALTRRANHTDERQIIQPPKAG